MGDNYTKGKLMEEKSVKDIFIERIKECDIFLKEKMLCFRSIR